ncbi:MAG TPA: hypothetical protein VG167_06050 [Verrucomicrobiae bacterium]|nr:hypothetical protein [Verrucomicrobiae bacterium]
MARKLRVQYPGAIFHLMSRGDQREDIFFDDVDRHVFIKTLAEACQKTDWPHPSPNPQVLVWCGAVMNAHETPAF